METQDISKMSLEELTALAKEYGLSESKSIRTVKIDALVILKIIKHCRENLPELVTGQLLGMDVGNTLEITSSYPFPSLDDVEDKKTYQIDMMLSLREVNVDNNAVGWYTSTFGSFLPESLINDQFKYQQSIKKCVVLVYDPLKTSQGQLSFKAFRLTKAFMSLYENENFTQASISKSDLSFDHIFEEIPIQINNPKLVEAFLLEFEGNEKALGRGCEFDRLDLSSNPFLEKNLQFLAGCTNEFSEEQHKYNSYQRALARQQQAIRKKKQAGETDEEIAAAFKTLNEPNHYSSLLLAHQINNYCVEINHFAAEALAKVHLLQGLQYHNIDNVDGQQQKEERN